MKAKILRTGLALALFAVTSTASSLLLADNDEKAGMHGKQDEHRQGNAQHEQKHFDKDRREMVRNYFTQESQQGHCPPGLAKKNNGCKPPGQVKRWEMGQNLHSDVNYYGLPADLTRLLGQTQPGYHYGMVDSDILLLMDGTEQVIDAITNLGQ